MPTFRASTGKLIRMLLCCVSLILAPKTSHGQTLTLFGTNDLAIETSLTVGVPPTQDATAVTSTIAFSGSFSGTFVPGPFDWSSVTEFGLLMSVPAADPQATFSIIFYNSNILDPEPADFAIAEFTGSTTGVANVMAVLPVTKNNSFNPLGGTNGLNDFTDVAAMQFTWGSGPTPGGSATAELGGIAIVPEPSTWALFICGTAICGVLAWRRRSGKLHH